MQTVNTKVQELSSSWMEAIEYLDNRYEGEDRGWRSTTELISPPRSVILRERHSNEIVLELTELMKLLVGNAGHELLERAAPSDACVEQRFLIEVEGKKIGIKADRVNLIEGTEDDYLLIDYKFSSHWTLMLGDKDEWKNQACINAYALRRIGINVVRAQNEVNVVDWSRREASQNPNYPQTQLQIVKLELMDDEEALEYLIERVRLFSACEDLEDDALPECTHDERWAKNDTFAVMKKGAKRSSKNCTSRLDAENYMKERGYSTPGYEIQFRAGESTRCLWYCPAKDFCSQFKKLKENG